MALTRSGATRANFGDLLEPGLREIFFQQYSELPTVYDKVFHVLKSTRQQETDSSVSGFGQLVETTEGAPITYEDPIQGLEHKVFILSIHVIVLKKLSKMLETLKIIITTYVITLWNKTISRQKPFSISVG